MIEQILSSEGFGEYLTEYRKRALEDLSEEEIWASMTPNETRSVWRVGDGFGVAEIREDEKGTKGVLVNHLYIKSNGDIREFDQKIGEWGKTLGAKWVGFYTRRNPAAFLRKLGNGWELDSYVLTRAI